MGIIRVLPLLRSFWSLRSNPYKTPIFCIIFFCCSSNDVVGVGGNAIVKEEDLIWAIYEVLYPFIVAGCFPRKMSVLWFRTMSLSICVPSLGCIDHARRIAWCLFRPLGLIWYLFLSFKLMLSISARIVVFPFFLYSHFSFLGSLI